VDEAGEDVGRNGEGGGRPEAALPPVTDGQIDVLQSDIANLTQMLARVEQEELVQRLMVEKAELVAKIKRKKEGLKAVVAQKPPSGKPPTSGKPPSGRRKLAKSASVEEVSSGSSAQAKTLMMAATADDDLLQRMLDLQADDQPDQLSDRRKGRSLERTLRRGRPTGHATGRSESGGRRTKGRKVGSASRGRSGSGSGSRRRRQDGGCYSELEDWDTDFPSSSDSSSRHSSDSEQEKFLARGKTKRQCKSGISSLSGAGTKVKKPQRWAQSGLLDSYSADSVSFGDLDLAMFTAGELGVALSRDTGKLERNSRLNLLRDLCYLATKKSMSVVRKIYASILNKIELCELEWGDNMQPQIQWMLALDHDVVKKSNVVNVAKGKGFKTSGNNFWCLSYNQGTCTRPENHDVIHKGSVLKAAHFCAKCFEKDKKKVAHPEVSDNCPHKSQ
jgi:hypothetical protein